MLEIERIDNGKAFDWGNTSEDYGKYRDIYPESYYKKLLSLGVEKDNQSILDIGTGTGVVARKIYKESNSIIGIDIEENQIEKAKELSIKENKNIKYLIRSAEDTGLGLNEFDFIIAAQCYIYFDRSKVLKEIDRILKPNGKFIITWFCWLPYESKLAKASEDLILKFNPDWGGAGFKDNFEINFDMTSSDFIIGNQIRYKERIPFTKETWCGRIRATRGVGAVLNSKELNKFDEEHKDLMNNFKDHEFEIPHLVLMNTYKRRDL